MSLEYPEGLKYLDSHEYLSLEGDVVSVGISAFAVDALGDIVFIELPEVGTEVAKGETCGNVESVKAAEDYYAPLSGEVIEINDALEEAPETLNEDPYGEGWIFKLRATDLTNELDGVMSAAEYKAKVETSE